MPDGGECIAKFGIFRSSIADAVGCEQGKIQRACNGDGGEIAGLFIPTKMALQLDIHIAVAKQ